MKLKVRLFIISLIPFLFYLQGMAYSKTIPFETIDQGEISYFHYGDPNFSGAEMVIQDQKTWTWFWKIHVQGSIPSPPVPKVNFNREMILVVILGHQTTGGGPGIEIKLIQEIDTYRSDKDEVIRSIGFPNGIRVLVEENKIPGLLDIITNPYHIVRVKKYPTVVFGHQSFDEYCTDSTQCEEEEYCEKKIGDCEGKGVCRPKPDGCIQVYDPVCGCDGKTYGNACAAAMLGAPILHLGACGEVKPCFKNKDCDPNLFCLFPEGKCSGPGVCTPKPDLCLLYYDPVCGCNMKTYGNHCEAYSHGISILQPGECF